MRGTLIKFICFIRIIKFKFLKDGRTKVIGKPLIKQPVLFAGKGVIEFGVNVQLGFLPSPYFYDGHIYLEARKSSAIIEFGNNILVNNNLRIIAEGSTIKIGDNSLIGTNVEILDSDFHHTDPANRNSGTHKSFPVIIHKNVFIGNNVVILKGVEIGENSVVANGSLVFKSIPPNVIVAGNPAEIIKSGFGKN